MTTAAQSLAAGSFDVDPIHSTFAFAVRYQGVSLFRGELTEGSGSLEEGVLVGSAPVESISIQRPEEFRAYVLGPEFFDVANHPEVNFTSSRLDLGEDDSVTAEGGLTIKGITVPITASGTWTAPEADAFGATRGHLRLEAEVDRTAFDLMWEMQLPSGAKALANEVTLTVDLSLTERTG